MKDKRYKRGAARIESGFSGWMSYDRGLCFPAGGAGQAKNLYRFADPLVIFNDQDTARLTH
jgi:hypothetical protein